MIGNEKLPTIVFSSFALEKKMNFSYTILYWLESIFSVTVIREVNIRCAVQFKIVSEFKACLLYSDYNF